MPGAQLDICDCPLWLSGLGKVGLTSDLGFQNGSRQGSVIVSRPSTEVGSGREWR
jgi:hypothetical protein